MLELPLGGRPRPATINKHIYSDIEYKKSSNLEGQGGRGRLYLIPAPVPAHLSRNPTVYQERADTLSKSTISIY